ncbi:MULTISPECIES: RNA polymerase sigma factor [Sporomusa]|uniref:RNA polymerase sigma factor n=1 Tax=Sporomusa TaxID=2375 RepID=UPI0016679A02|nr:MULTISPECIES: sigma-70 family RNA polymerase sigma factor [Sporomusa]HML35114.1 sigma-70 family RNA polymerase sigma factor [Sporomusa sphaeroides]
MGTHELQFDQVYAEFQPKIYRYLTRLIGLKDAEDVTQDVFIKVNRALHTFKKDSQLSTWIYQIATNAAIDRMRSQPFKQESAEQFNESDIDRLAAKNTYSYKKPLLIEDQVVRQEMNECIRNFVMDLPENYRTVAVLSEIEGLKDSEIAAILGVSINTVKIRLHRAKNNLRKLLLANCNFYRTDCNELACEQKGPSSSQ